MYAKNKNHQNIGVNKSFETYISDYILGQFQDLFIADDVPTHGDIEFMYQYSLNVPDDNNTEAESENIESIAVNIAGLTFKQSSKYCWFIIIGGNFISTSLRSPLSSISLLPPIFNLLRNLQFHRSGNLIPINALLGCAIVLPKCVNSPSEMDIFDDYDAARAKKILDVNYHTINWMRETIGAFVTQDDRKTRRKVRTIYLLNVFSFKFSPKSQNT